MGASNKVIAGDYNNCIIVDTLDIIDLTKGFLGKTVAKINRETIESYEILTEEYNRSAGNVAARGLIGAALLGPLGLAAGVLSSKKKGIIQISLQFKDGKKSLIEVNDKIAKRISTVLF